MSRRRLKFRTIEIASFNSISSCLSRNLLFTIHRRCPVLTQSSSRLGWLFFCNFHTRNWKVFFRGEVLQFGLCVWLLPYAQAHAMRGLQIINWNAEHIMRLNEARIPLWLIRVDGLLLRIAIFSQHPVINRQSCELHCEALSQRRQFARILYVFAS